jgi:hypothetical protein
MKAILTGALALLLAGSAIAQERAFAIGHARPGMRLSEFRYSPHGAGNKVICSNDAQRPPGTSALDLPKIMTKAELNRCSVFSEKAGFWQQAEVPLAGAAAEFWLMAIKDDSGTERVAQIYARQPRPAYEKTLALLSDKLGPPAESRPGAARWKSAATEASAAHDGYEVKIFLAEPRLQALMQSRLDAAAKKK